MRIATLTTTCQTNTGIYFGNYEVYQNENGILTYNAETGVYEDYTSLEAMKRYLKGNTNVISIEYKVETKELKTALTTKG